MLSLLRLTVFVLALPFLTATAAVEVAFAPSARPLHASFGIAEAKLGAPAKLTSSTVKRITAALEDGPEGEEAPLVSLVRGYDGDDQAEASAAFVLIAFDFVVLVQNATGATPAPRYFPCAGYPTGPPAA